MTRKRKTPIRHKVRSHIRQGYRVNSFLRGKGTQKLKITKRKVIDIKINGTIGDIDVRIAGIVKKLNQHSFVTSASCEGHLYENGKLTAFVSFGDRKTYNTLWKIALAEKFTPYCRDWPSQWQYHPTTKPVLDKGNKTYTFIKKFNDYYIELYFKPRDVTSSITVVSLKNFDYSFGKKPGERIKVNYDEFHPDIKFTGKKPLQTEWNKSRTKAFEYMINKMNRWKT